MRCATIAIVTGITISILLGCGNDPSFDRGARFEPLAAPVGLERTSAAALSGDGRVVVGSGSPWRFEGYEWQVALRWAGARAESLDVPGRAFLVSGDGAVVAGSRTLALTLYRDFVLPVASEPFTWSRANGTQAFFWRPPEQRVLSLAVMSPDARILLGTVSAVGGDGEAYRWTDGDAGVLPAPATGRSPTPTAMTPDGSVIAGTVEVFVPRDDGGSEGRSRAVRWADGKVVRYPGSGSLITSRGWAF